MLAKHTQFNKVKIKNCSYNIDRVNNSKVILMMCLGKARRKNFLAFEISNFLTFQFKMTEIPC